jgi:transposase
MADVPRLTDPEWQAIARILPPGREMATRHADRTIAEALLYAEAAGCSLEDVPAEYLIPSRTLRTRLMRWRADGTWPLLLAAGAGAVERFRRELEESEDLLTQLARVSGW